MDTKIIALYLPQFHPTEDNDKWWGVGFREWTNVGKAKPLFKGHQQPRVPADLGYYDLRLPQVREQQAQLARRAGIYGFCYYHYWFGNGKRELELPFNEVLRSGNPDFPFCLCWANESWHSKFWNKDGAIDKKILVEQQYPGDEDIVMHFNTLLPAFKDNRYIRIDDKPVFMIYRAFDYKDMPHFIEIWQKLAKDKGLNGIYFIAHLAEDVTEERRDKLIEMGFDAVNTNGLWEAKKACPSILYKIKQKLKRRLLGMPNIYDYKSIYPYFERPFDSDENVFPTIFPNWDHTPRSGSAGYVLTGSSPELFGKHVKSVLNRIKHKKIENRVVFLKSWNEWGEGNYMEPDLTFGCGYIDELKKVLLEFKK